MHHNRRNNVYRSYSYLHPSFSTSSQNTHYRYYNPRLRAQQLLYPNATTTTAYTSSHLLQRYQPVVGISDLAEPMSAFDDLKFPRRRSSDVIPFPSIYTPRDSIRRTVVSDPRLATASAMRERLLIDIQQSISEIDDEITLLEQRSAISRYNPARFSSVNVVPRRKSLDKIILPSIDDSRTWADKSSRTYNVMPRIASPTKKFSPSLTEQTTSQLFLSQYHYAPEAEEIEIDEKDAENTDLKLVAHEILDSHSRELLSLTQFRRVQSDIPENRVLIFVPEYVDGEQTELTETAEDFHQTNPVNADMAQLSVVHSSGYPGASNKLSIQDFQSFTHTAPEPSKPKPDEIEIDPIDTMLSKPVRHARLSTKSRETFSSSADAIANTKNNNNNTASVDASYFFSDFGNEAEDEEDFMSIDPSQFTMPVESEIFTEENMSHILIRQSQTSLLNPQSSQQQQRAIENNNEYVKERESEKIDPTTNYIITSPSTLSSEKLFSISIYDSMQTQFMSDDSRIIEEQREAPSIKFNSNPTEQSTENQSNNLVKIERKTSSKNSNSPRQRSASLYHSPENQSSYILSRGSSISSANNFKIPFEETEYTHDNKERRSTQSSSHSPLPIPLNSPDLNTVRPSTSRSITPERRNSFSSLEKNILLTSADINDLGELRIAPSPLKNPSNELELLNNQDRNRSPCSSMPEQEYTRLPSVSPVDIETNELEHDPPGLLLTSPGHHTDPIMNFKLEPKSPIKDEEEYLHITASQRRSKLSLIIRRPSNSKQKTPIHTQRHTIGTSTTKNDEKLDRHVLFSNDILYSQMDENHRSTHWRERIGNILSKKHFPKNKYSHIKSRVDSFGNFDYQSRKISRPTIDPIETKGSKLNKRQIPPGQFIPPVKKGPTRQMFGRLWTSPDGRSKIFHETLRWNVPSKIKAYSLENLHYKSRRNAVQTSNKNPRWHSESRVAKLVKATPRRQILAQAIWLPIISREQELENEMKIFDINSIGQQSMSKFEDGWFSNASWTSKRSQKTIFDEKLVRRKKSKLKDSIWTNINYQPKKSTIQISHQPTHWTRQSKLQITHSLTLDIRATVNYWSEIDLHQLTKTKALFSQYHSLQWNDIISDNIHPTDTSYSFLSFDTEENSNDQTQDESPANQPKWNAVSKTRSVNSVYNPKIPNANSIRRGWDFNLRQKRVQKLPPLKRKKIHNAMPHLASEAPPPNGLLAIEDNYDHLSIPYDQATSIAYTTSPSRRSSKALVPLPRLPDFQLLSETPRSQRPVQQEWYDELSKSRSTHRTEVGRTRNNSFQDSMGSVHQIHTSREFRPSTRNSQNSLVSGTVLDSSIRTNRTTELRLSRNMEEHHQHSHDPSQSMPFEIRGFRLEGTQLTVPDHTTIRPLSNVSYHSSERVKTHRLYPWSVLHASGAFSRHSSLVPITEMRHPSFEASTVELPQLIIEE